MSTNNSNSQNKLTNCNDETSSHIDLELFKSNVCHSLKEKGDIDFIIDLLEKDEITEYYKRKWYPECLYLLTMLNYISNVNSITIYIFKYFLFLTLSLIFYTLAFVSIHRLCKKHLNFLLNQQVSAHKHCCHQINQDTL